MKTNKPKKAARPAVLGKRPKPPADFDEDHIPDATDPDAWGPQPADDSWIPAGLPVPSDRTHVHMRCDADMLEWFRSQGPGYQRHINNVLVRYYRHHVKPNRP